MPGWHQATKELVKQGKLVVLGVTQEQHAERCRLFAQWQGFDWPIVQDAFTEIGMAVVPVAVLIDEHGIVQNTRPRTSEIEQLVSEVSTSPSEPAAKLTRESITIEARKQNLAARPENPVARIQLGDAYMKWGADDSVALAIDQYESAMKKLDDATDITQALQFRLGVAHRKRFDEKGGANTSDFKMASQYWSAALKGNPNQYIWRRRIEQYGPSLIKPYEFYDWVSEARKEILERGDRPIELKVPLAGSEIAKRQKKFIPANEAVTNPDPDAKIQRDVQGLVNVDTTLVPSNPQPGDTVRVYLHFQTGKGKWNNESSPMQIWIEGKGGEANKQLMEIANGKEATSSESRWVEFEFQLDEESKNHEVSGFGLFNVCESDEGACLFRRKEFRIQIVTDK